MSGISSPTRREMLAATAAAGAISMLPGTLHAASGGDAIRPFTVNFPQSDLDELRRRVAATRLPERETVADSSQGVQLATVQKLAQYWATDYDWRKVEARLNSYPKFITEIDGLDIHFIHVRSKHENALPVIVTHGWPGSVIEQLKIIDPLTDPTAHGGSAADAFDVVIPSMPGYGFSGKPTTTGWGPGHIARAWDVLMKRLGYTQYVAQGGDWGAIITDMMGVQAPPGLLGIHTNMAGRDPARHRQGAGAGATRAVRSLRRGEAGLRAAWRSSTRRASATPTRWGLRPQTLSGMADSPVGLAAFMLDHDARSLADRTRPSTGRAEGLTRDDVLDNITLYLADEHGGVLRPSLLGAAREGAGSASSTSKASQIPVAVSVFPDELYQAPRSWAEQAYPNLIHYNKLDKGGHFAAWEQPALFVADVRAGFRPLRQSI